MGLRTLAWPAWSLDAKPAPMRAPTGNPGCVVLLRLRTGRGARTGETAPRPPTHTQRPGLVTSPWSPLLTVASFHFARMTSLKMWTPPGTCGLSTRQPGALSEGLEVTCAPEVGADGDLGVRRLLPPPVASSSLTPPPLPCSFLVLALRSAPPRGPPFPRLPVAPVTAPWSRRPGAGQQAACASCPSPAQTAR